MENDSQQLTLTEVPPSIKKSKVAPLEKAVEARLVSRVRAAGGISWKFVSDNTRGVADRIVLINGRVIFVEVKRDGGKMSPLQHSHMLKVIANGGEHALVEGMDGVDAFMAKLKSDSGTFNVFFRAIWSMINKFKGFQNE